MNVVLLLPGTNRQSRLQQLIDWCGGEQFNGCLIFDECHKAKHFVPVSALLRSEPLVLFFVAASMICYFKFLIIHQLISEVTYMYLPGLNKLLVWWLWIKAVIFYPCLVFGLHTSFLTYLLQVNGTPLS